MFNVTTGIYESHHSPFADHPATVTKQGSGQLEFQALLQKVGSDASPTPPKVAEAESASVSRESLAKPKTHQMPHEYEPLPEGCRAPEVSWTIQAMYCEARGPAPSEWQPDWEAAASRRTIGGHGDTDGSGNIIFWGDANRDTLAAGEVFETPAGDYQVVTNKWGDLVLRPLDDAWRGAGDNFRSLTIADHHIGVHPKTGEVWYQARA